MTKVEKFIAEMTKKHIPAHIKEYDKSIDVELGWNYPDRLFDKVWDIAEKFDVEIDIMADSSGPTPNRITRTGEGPKSYFK